LAICRDLRQSSQIILENLIDVLSEICVILLN
jgi:hypothetical protein